MEGKGSERELGRVGRGKGKVAFDSKKLSVVVGRILNEDTKQCFGGQTPNFLPGKAT